MVPRIVLGVVRCQTTAKTARVGGLRGIKRLLGYTRPGPWRKCSPYMPSMKMGVVMINDVLIHANDYKSISSSGNLTRCYGPHVG